MLNNLLKTRNGRILVWIIVILAIGAFLWLTAPKTAAPTQPPANVNNSLQPAVNANININTNINTNVNKPKISAPTKKPAAPKVLGYVEKRAPHFVSANIANNATIAQVPSYLTLTFNAPLLKSTQTTLTVKKNDVTDATASTSSINDKTLVVRLNALVTDGDYSVYYVACFVDTGCNDGRFGYHLKLPK